MSEDLRLSKNVERPKRIQKQNDGFSQKPCLREIVQTKTGLTIEEYAEQNPYDNSEYIEFGRAGREGI